jgi:TBC1 domain family member 5
MPENVYFRQPETQKMLLDILFIYCKLNPDVGYRQGMHELVAPVLWVVERDAVDASTAGPEDDELLVSTLDSRYVEHDTFTLFALIMQNGKSFYEPGTDGSPSVKQGNGSSESPILVRCSNIFDSLLPSVDPELSDHLHSLDITPQIFLM